VTLSVLVDGSGKGIQGLQGGMDGVEETAIAAVSPNNKVHGREEE
jgi:hypothetical protein